MGGGLVALSVFGEGSTFEFDVLLKESEQLPAESRTAIELSGRSVLVVDDDPTNRLILSEMCMGWGMTPVEAANGIVASDVVQRAVTNGNTFSLVLLDRVMPDVDGLATLATLLTIDPSLPIIITSSDDQPGDLTKAKTIGAAGYLKKPIRSAELLTLISETLRERPRQEKSLTADLSTFDDESSRREHVMRILVAEDSEDNRFLVGAYLAKRPYDLSFAVNGKLAVEAFSKGTFDLVLMDVQMPVMDGLSAAAAIRVLEQERATNPIPIVALTANAMMEDLERSRVAGCNAHLSKPISKEKLISIIESFRPVPKQIEPHPADTLRPELNYLVEIPEGFEEASRNYLAAKRKEVSDLLQLSRDQDLNELALFGHNLKGTAASFGFPELSNLGAAIEGAAMESNTVVLADQLSQVNEYVEYATETLG